jgi:ABC-2 type transport system permease protein
VALGVLGVSDVLGTPASQLPPGFDPTAAGLKGFLFAQLVIGMLGALAVTSEYSTGTIVPSLAVVPSRSRLLAAKTLVVAAVAALTAALTTGISFAAAQLLLHGAGLPTAGPGTPGVFGALAAATLYLTLVALLGVAIGVLTRSSTSGLSVLVGALLLVPALAPGLPGAVGEVFARYWPITAGQSAYAVVPVDGQIAPGLGLLILTAAVVALTAAGHQALRARDV